jgi:PKD domain
MQLRGIQTVLLAALIAVAALIGSTSAHADVPAAGDFSPAIWSDKADYSPGEHVVLSGANWLAGESVHITVNDDAGSTWTRSVDVTADDTGNITDEFDLPSWFVAQYSVRAEGASGSVATYAFTDSNVKFDVTPVGTTTTVKRTVFSGSTNCSTGGATPTTLTNTPGDNVGGVNQNDSVRLEANPTSDQGGTFKNWTDDSNNVIAGGAALICVRGVSGTLTVHANYNAAANSAPAIASDGASVTVNEGAAASNTGTWSDANASDTVTLTASVGTVTKSGTNSGGTWSWSYTPPDGPTSPSPQVVTITAGDGTTTTSTTFSLTVNNVAPTVALSAANDLTVSEGTTVHTYSYTISDPGVDTVTGVSTSCGTNGTKVAGSDTNTNTTGSFQCRFLDGPATSSVSAAATDSDGATGVAASQTVAVNNVIPVVTAPSNQTANEGASTSFNLGSFTDPGADSPWSVDVNWGDGSAHTVFNQTTTGSITAQSHSYTDDGTYTVTVAVKDKDNATSVPVTFTVTVSNVAPTVTAAANQSSDEGSSTSFTLGSFTDPGANDSLWAVDVDWGDGSAHTTFNATSAGTIAAKSHTYADGPNTYTVKVKVTDKDTGTNTAQFTVTVNNVAPTVTLDPSNDLTVNEGSTAHTYSYTISDPGVDTVTGVSTSCGTNGTKVAGSDTNTNTTGSFQCRFLDGPASSTVSASATDSDGATGNLATQSVTVNNVAPTVNLTGATNVDEGSTHTYTFTVTDPGQDTFTVDSGFPDCDAGATNNGTLVGGTLSVNAGGGSFDCTFPDGPSTANVKIKVTDSDNASDTTSQDVEVTTVANVAPAITAAANQSANEGASSSFNLGSFTDPGPDAPWSVDVDWGDGSAHTTFSQNTTGSLGAQSHTYADGPATRTVSVSVTDKNNGTDTKTFTVTVNNVAPTVTLSAANDLSVNEGQTRTYSYTISDPGQDTIDHVTTSCGANGTKGTETNTNAGGSFQCTFPDGDATSTVSASATDSDLDTGNLATQSVAIHNVAPTVTLGANDLSVNEGSTHTYSYTISDPGSDTVSSVSTSCGTAGTKVPGSDTNTNSAGSFQCKFPDGPDSSTVSANATDSDGATGNTSTQTVTVNNVAPTVSLTGADQVDEGTTHTYTFTVSDPGQDTFVASAGYPDCDFGGTDGALEPGSYAATATGGSFKCSFPDGPKSADVRMKVADSDGASGTDSESVQIVAIANVNPVVTAAAPQSADEGASTAIDLGSFSDQGASDANWTVDVDWGDGSTHASFPTATAGAIGTKNHTYADGPDDHTVIVKVTDKDGGYSSASFTVHVKNVAPTVTFSASNDLSVNEGSTHTYSYTISDPAQDTVSAVTTSCGANGTKGTESNTNAGGSFTCTFPDGDATSTVSASATDSDNDTGNTDTQNVEINNVAPTVTLSATNDLSVNEGSIHTYSYTISDPGQDTVSAVTTSCGANGTKGTESNTNAGGSFQCTFPDGPASSIVSASATDSDSDTGNTDTQTVSVANLAPTVIVTGDNTADEGTTHTYNFSVTDAGDDTFTAAAGYPDCDSNGSNGTLVAGSYAPTATGGSFTCLFPDGPATANVKMSVVDSDGDADSDSENVQVTTSVANVNPTVTPGANQDANEGIDTSIDLGSFSDPGPDGAWHVDVDWGDGSAHTTFDTTTTGALGGQSHSYSDGPATQTVTVKVTDKDGGSDTKTFQVTVKNVAPTATLSNNGPIDEGGSATVSFSAPSDVAPDAAAGFHYEFHCDGSAFGTAASYASAGSSSSTSCSYADNGTKTVRARIIDKDDGAREYTTNVTVNNVAPVITAAADQTGTEGSSGNFDLGSFTDANPNDGDWNVDVDWGDGSAHTTFTKTAMGATGTKSHTYADNSTYTVTVTVTDKDGGNSSKTFKITVGNVKPTITSFTGTDYLVGPNAFILGGAGTSRFTTNFTDPSSADTFKADFSYQDGSPLTETLGAFTPASASFTNGRQNTHEFAKTVGCKTASVKVSDDDGGYDTATTTVHIGSGAFQPPMTNQPVTDKLKNGQVLPVKVHITDCSGAGALGLNPAIRLVQGDSTPQNDDTTATITPGSVSSADTTGIMRSQGGGDYMYNMRVDLAKLNQDFTVVIYPYGTSSPIQLGHVIQATK